MHFALDPSSPDPVYVQIVRQMKLGVAQGRLVPGERLPAVRELAMRLLVNPNTVQKAYRALTQEGVIHSRKGQGMFVAEISPTLNRKERTRRVTELADSLIAECIHLGLQPEEIERLIAGRTSKFGRRSADD